MHDINELDLRGVPGVFVASVEFEAAAEAQGSALGFHPPRVLVPHPIQDRTDEEMRTIADEAAERIIAAVLTDATG